MLIISKPNLKATFIMTSLYLIYYQSHITAFPHFRLYFDGSLKNRIFVR